MSHPTAIRVSNEIEKRVGKAAGTFLQMVECFTIEAGISDLLAFQTYRALVKSRNLGSWPAHPSFLIWMMLRLPRGPLRPRATCRSSMSKDPSFAWIYAVSVFQPEFIMAETGLSRQELQDFSTWICSEFFQKTADLLKKAKNVDSVTDYWATLNENLTTIYLLARYINFERLLAASSARLASHPKILASVKSLVEGCEDVKSHPKATLATREKMARRIENAFEIFGEILFNENMVDEIITGDSDELDHLQSYTQHWLEKLGEGPVPYSQMIVKIFQLNTLCRIDFRDNFKERGEYPPTRFGTVPNPQSHLDY